MKTLRSIWIWGASASLIVLWTPLLALVRLFDRDPMRIRTGRWMRRLGRNVSRVNPWRLHVTGQQNLDPRQVYVVVSNHQSLADIPLICHVRLDAKWLAKAELFRLPFAGWMITWTGDIPVARADRRKAAQALLQCARCLRGRCSVVFFPEGTRSPDGEVKAFNDGPFQLALREKVPVLPLAVEGSGSALPRDTWQFGPAQDIYLSVLEPVSPEGWESAAALRDEVRSRISREVVRLREQAEG
jgi:1-acyl-sn-glycerol-3-phosphate acyltransferase